MHFRSAAASSSLARPGGVVAGDVGVAKSSSTRMRAISAAARRPHSGLCSVMCTGESEIPSIQGSRVRTKFYAPPTQVHPHHPLLPCLLLMPGSRRHNIEPPVPTHEAARVHFAAAHAITRRQALVDHGCAREEAKRKRARINTLGRAAKVDGRRPQKRAHVGHRHISYSWLHAAVCGGTQVHTRVHCAIRDVAPCARLVP